MKILEEVRLAQRCGTAAEWTQVDPVLFGGEIGFEEDTGKFKIGDGESPWHLLTYYVNEDGVQQMIEDYVESVGGGTEDLRIGDMNDLLTTHKETVVAAVNEVHSPGVSYRSLYINAKAG